MVEKNGIEIRHSYTWEIREAVARKLVPMFLALFILGFLLIMVENILEGLPLWMIAPELFAIIASMAAYLFYYKGRFLFAAWYIIAIIILALVALALAYGSFRTVGGILGTACLILWLAFFTSKRFMITVVILICIVGNGFVVYLNLSGVLTEKLLPNPRAAYFVAAFLFILLAIGLLRVVRYLMDTVGESRTNEKLLEDSLKKLKESQSFTIQAVDNSRQLFCWLTPDGSLQFANATAFRMVGCTSESVIGKPLWETPWFENSRVEQEKIRQAIDGAYAQKTEVRYAAFFFNAGGEKREFDVHIRPIFDSNGSITMLIAEGVDVTEEREAVCRQQKLAEQLHQSQKLDAIGQLAGGVAHDFNNVLSGIMGAADLLKTGRLRQEQSEKYINMIISSGHRAADLTKRLLAFARAGASSTAAIDLASVVNDTVALLKQTIDKKITVSVKNAACETRIIGNDSLLLNVLMNIGINASQAMPDGGELVFTMENRTLDAEYCANSSFNIAPGEFVEISVRDTGSGMSPEIISRIFEPFFTTKEPGKGTGLGLSAVYGTIREHHGAITVASEVGKGTDFHVLLPVQQNTSVGVPDEEPVPKGEGTILLIDDEETIRITAGAILEDLGYKVISADHGASGIDILRKNPVRFDLIILDMMMPVMNGSETLVRVREINKTVPVIISSGFWKPEDVEMMKAQGVAGILRKPFRMHELAEKVREAMVPLPGGISES